MRKRDQTAFLVSLRASLLQSETDLTLGAEEATEDYVRARIGLLPALNDDASVAEALAVIDDTQVDAGGGRPE